MSEKKKFKSNSKKVNINLNSKQTQIGIICGLVALIAVIAVIALSGKGKNPVKSEELYGDSYIAYSGSYDEFADIEYVDEYTLKMNEYSDVIIPENNIKDDDYIKETVLVGDSNTEALSNFNYVSIQHVLGYSGMGIQSVTSSRCMWFVGYDEPVTIPTAVSMMRPRRIIINFGTNNAGGMPVEDFIYTYKKAISAILKAYPYTDIIVESIFPVAKVRNYPNITMQDIDEMNLALAQMCRDNGYKFLNTSEVLKGNDGFINPEYISSDGIHLSSAGYTKVLEYIKSHKFITADQRPSKGSTASRRTAPIIDSSSSEIVSSSSSQISSSSVMSSSAVSSVDSSSVSSVISSSSNNASSDNSVAESTVSSTVDNTPEPSSQEEVHSHSYTETITQNATCVATGTKTYTCECGDSYTEVIPVSNNHRFDASSPTCLNGCGATNSEYVAPQPDPVPDTPTEPENTEG